MQKLMALLNYQFRQTDLLRLALTHRSLCAQNNNERLEFLGDAVLGFIISNCLMQRFPDAREGELSDLRSSLVKEESLFEIAKQLDLGSHLLLGAGERKSGGFNRKSTLADAVEAVIGAIYLDGGIQICEQTVLSWFELRLQALKNLAPDYKIQTLKDPKTRLQEYLQSLKMPLPVYTILLAKGEAHTQYFHIICKIPGIPYHPEGEGFSRKQAEQMAAELLLAWFLDKN